MLGLALTVALGALSTACFVAGSGLAQAVEPLLADPESVRALLAGLVVAALTAGVLTGASAPGVEGLGDQLGAAPARAGDRAGALLLVPMTLLTMVSVVVGAPLLGPTLIAGQGGKGAGFGAGVILVASVLCGAAFGAAVTRTLSTRDWIRTMPLLLASLGVLALGTASAARHLGGDDSAFAPLIAGVFAAVGATWTWAHVLSVAKVPTRRTRRSRSLATGVASASGSAAWLLLVRASETRACLVASVSLGLLGPALGVLVGAEADSGLLLGATTSAVVVAPVALAVGGRLGDGVHVWALAQRRHWVVAGWCLASVVLLAGPVIVLGVGTVVLFGAAATTAFVGLSTASASWAVAVVGGAVAPWRSTGFAQQAASIGVYAAGLGLVIAALALVAPRLEERGLPPWVVAAGLLGALGGAAFSSLALGMRGRG